MLSERSPTPKHMLCDSIYQKFKTRPNYSLLLPVMKAITAGAVAGRGPRGILGAAHALALTSLLVPPG